MHNSLYSYWRPRVIPCLLLKNTGLVKTRQFKDPVYLGDPRNVMKIFNDKEVDEIVLLDITATVEKRAPRLDLLGEIVTECFAPLGYGGGIRTADDARQLVNLGIEKVILNTQAVENPALISQIAVAVGSQSTVVSIDVRKARFGGYQVYTHSGTQRQRIDPVALAKQAQDAGAGEIVINSIDRDGMMNGYDLTLIQKITEAVEVPVVACGGAATVDDLGKAVLEGGASAAAAGSMFVFHGKLRGVLISFPAGHTLERVFSGQG